MLVLGLDLPFIVVAATSLRNAAAMSLELLIIHVVTMLMAALFCRRLSRPARLPVSVAVSAVAMVGARILLRYLFRGIGNSLGMYIYLMAINGMTHLQVYRMDKKARPWRVLTGSLWDVAGFSAMALAVAALREFFGNGTLWGVEMPVKIVYSGMTIPFFGFILVAFLMAFLRYCTKRLTGAAMMEAARREAHYTSVSD